MAGRGEEARVEDRPDLPALARGTPEGLRGDRVGGGAAGRRSGRGGSRRHVVRDRRLADQSASRVRLRAGPGLERDQRHRPGHHPHVVQPPRRARAVRHPARPLALLGARGCRRDRRPDDPHAPRVLRARDDPPVLVRCPAGVVRRDQRGAEAVQRGASVRRRRLQRHRHARLPVAGAEGGLRPVPRPRRPGEGMATSGRRGRAGRRAPRVRRQDRPPDGAGGVGDRTSSR